MRDFDKLKRLNEYKYYARSFRAGLINYHKIANEYLGLIQGINRVAGKELVSIKDLDSFDTLSDNLSNKMLGICSAIEREHQKIKGSMLKKSKKSAK